ncbi:MAG: hypothetical protein F4X60_09585 [Gemmatimonadetes bacterium]|nr:hypothetical protein [Gemmatimonadota bacterium]MYB98793.1 hypothetical protein [Gemmatimonadota bacterium]
MKIGLKDIRHLAIIGAAGAAGVAATLMVVKASEGPRVHHEVITVDRAPVIHIRSNVHVVEPARERADQVVRERLRRVEYRSAESIEPVVYVDGIRVESLDGLNPLDIAKVDVFKGDKAVELYGKQARERGVVVVTTKKGKKKGSGEEAEKGR